MLSSSVSFAGAGECVYVRGRLQRDAKQETENEKKKPGGHEE